MPIITWRPPGQTKPPKVIFVPGIASDGRAWYRQMPLAEHWPWAAVDVPLEVPEAPYTFDILALLLREVIYEICDAPPVVVGSSFGGMLTLTYALQYPDAIAGQVLVGAAADARWFIWPFRIGYDLMRQAPHAGFTSVFPLSCAFSGLTDHQDAETLRLFYTQGLAFRPQHYANRIHAVGRLRLQDEAHRITCPTLLMHGTGDHTIPVTASLRLANVIPHAELRILPGGSHSMYLRSHRWFNRNLAEWVDSLLAKNSLEKSSKRVASTPY